MKIKLALAAAISLSFVTGAGPSFAMVQDAHLPHVKPAEMARELAAATKESLLARPRPSSLLQSTGNLYWTVNTENEFSPNSSSVYRTAKSGGPSRLLYRESGQRSFGALAYARVGGIWYGYVAAKDAGSFGKARIQRFLLDGGGQARTVVHRSSTITALASDGTSLFWADGAGVHTLPLVGNGLIRTLVSGAGIDRISLAGPRLFYSTGRSIHYVSLPSGKRSLLATASSPVTALYATFVRPNVVQAYWGESNGRVAYRGLVGDIGPVQSAQTGRRVTSVSFDGARTLWTDCTINGLECLVRSRIANTWSTISVAHGYAFAVQGDLTRTFWAAPEGLKSYTR